MLYLDQIKKHLNIDDDFNGDDEYLLHLRDVASAVVQRHINDTFESIAVHNGGELPPPLLHAMLLFIGMMYECRESVTYTSATEVPLSYSYLLDLYKNYNKNECV